MFVLINNFLSPINDFLWSWVLISVLVGLGIWFTIASRFVQFRYFVRMFYILGSGRIFTRNPGGHLSSFQALMVSVAGRVGGGNIAGVAVAIALGGPGAIFWMWCVGIIGMATSFVECTLAQAYKRVARDGTYQGGPAFYITYGLGKKWKWLAGIFSALLLLTYGFGFNGAQSYTISISLHDAFGIPIPILVVGLAVLVGFIIIGGIQRIAHMADILVPVMAIGYIAVAFLIMLLNISAVPDIFMLIVKNAFGLDSAVGGSFGAAVIMGVRRGLFSNEAGLGSAPNVAAVADVRHPASQGIVQAFSVFIDTIVICSCTACIILLGDVYYTGGTHVDGISLTQASLAGCIGEWGRIFVSVALTLFGFTTIVYNSYLGESSLIWFTGQNKIAVFCYRVLVIVLCGWGASSDLETIFSFADFTMGLLAVVNLFALLLLIRPALRLIRDYDHQLAKGVDEPVFNAKTFAQPGIDQEIW